MMSAVLKPGSRFWVAGGLLLVVAVFALDQLTAATVPPSVFVVGALVTAVGGSEPAAAAVAVLATTLAVVAVALRPGPLDRMDTVRLGTAGLIGALAILFAVLRRRLERRTAEADGANRRAKE